MLIEAEVEDLNYVIIISYLLHFPIFLKIYSSLIARIEEGVFHLMTCLKRGYCCNL